MIFKRRSRTLPFGFTIVFLFLLFLLIADLMEGWEALPFLVEKTLKFDAGLIYQGAGRVEKETITNHQFEVVKKLLSSRVLEVLELLSNGRKVHWLLDNFRVTWNVQLDPVYSRHKKIEMSEQW